MTTEITLSPLTDADFAGLKALAESIWRAHYIKIISAEQIEYMLRGRYTPQNLARYIGSDQRWLQLLRVDGVLGGYCSYARTENLMELKLEQLYVLPALHGKGHGGLMLRHVEERAAALGCNTLVLSVNKQNHSSIAVYQKRGFTIREEAVFEIGNGYVMDDYVMEKRL